MKFRCKMLVIPVKLRKVTFESCKEFRMVVLLLRSSNYQNISDNSCKAEGGNRFRDNIIYERIDWRDGGSVVCRSNRWLPSWRFVFGLTTIPSKRCGYLITKERRRWSRRQCALYTERSCCFASLSRFFR